MTDAGATRPMLRGAGRRSGKFLANYGPFGPERGGKRPPATERNDDYDRNDPEHR